MHYYYYLIPSVLSLCSVFLFSICLISTFILCMVLELNSSEAWISDSEEKQRVLQGIVFIAVNCIFKSVLIYSSYYAEKYQMRLYELIIDYNKHFLYTHNKLYYSFFHSERNYIYCFVALWMRSRHACMYTFFNNVLVTGFDVIAVGIWLLIPHF